MTSKKILIIGGGVIGTACAYYLNRAGYKVTIVEQGRFAGGASHANCGLVCPSHVLPLAGPGVMGKTLKAMLSPNSPFSIRPRLDASLWSWLLAFVRHCNEKDMFHNGRIIQELLNTSRRLYDELFETEPLDAEWERRGLLFAFQSKSAMDHYAHTDKLMREHFNAGAVRYDGDAVAKLEPALQLGLAGGWHYEGDAHLRPDKLMSSWRGLLEQRGVEIHEQCEFQGFSACDTSHAAIALTNRGHFHADTFVVATGAWTPLLNRQLGCRVPIQPGKGYSITMARPARCPTIPLIFEEHRVAVTPMQSGYRLGSIMEFAGYDSTIDPRRIEMLKSAASHYLIEPTAEPVVEEWTGWRPMTPDSLPIIQRIPSRPNVIIATGHNMLGLSMAPATGLRVAEMVEGMK